jgi:hypothetical protein
MSQAAKPHHLLVDLALFAATLALAAHQRWSTTDLVWSLWVSSLVVGYSLIVTSILGSLAHGGTAALLARRGTGGTPAASRGVPFAGCAAVPFNAFIVFATVMVLGWGRVALVVLVLALASSAVALGGLLRTRSGFGFLPDPERGVARLLVMLPGATFMLGFFTVHFGMFHFIHGLFLNGFFPLVTASPAGKNPEQVFGIVGSCAREALLRYWPFVLASGLSRLPGYAGAWATTDGTMMMKPYLNVIRMHVMIFVFGFLSAAGLQSYALYPLLAVYFLPLGGLLALARGRARPSGPALPSG